MLYPYQQSWVKSRPRFKIGMFARQTGKTFTTTLEIVDDCVEAATQGRRKRWVILSRGERQAKEAINEGVKLHCQAYQMGYEAEGYIWTADSGASYNALEVKLPHGSRITALPANPDTARGFSANAYLDEFAFHQNSRAIWGALFPVISAGHRVVITSTGNGKNNKFYDLMTGTDTLWDRHRVDIYEAVAQGLVRNIEELRLGLDDEDLWGQEYELRWLDEASAWLDYDLINSVEDEEAGSPEAYAGGYSFIGNDIARRNDLWVAWVWEQIGDVLWTREIVELHRASFREQDQVLDDLMNRYHVLRLCMDQGGMGEKPVEDAKLRYGESRVEGVMFTQASKLHMATLGKRAFQTQKVRIPMENQKLRSDLHSLKKVSTPTGGVRFDVDSSEKHHADRAWACFLGLYAAEAPPSQYRYEKVDPYSERAQQPQSSAGGFRRRSGAL